MTMSEWERGASRVPAAALVKLLALYGATIDDLPGGRQKPSRVSENVSRGTYGRLPPRSYAIVHGYLEQMRKEGCSDEQIDEAERLMVQGAFNKINKRDPRERSEEDLITDIDAAWDFIRSVLRKEGKRL